MIEEFIESIEMTYSSNPQMWNKLLESEDGGDTPNILFAKTTDGGRLWHKLGSQVAHDWIDNYSELEFMELINMYSEELKVYVYNDVDDISTGWLLNTEIHDFVEEYDGFKYIIDYGGDFVGSDDLYESLGRKILKYIEDEMNKVMFKEAIV